MAKAMAVANDDNQANRSLSQMKALPERLGSFLKDVRAEMRKVITPSRAEVQATTTVVIVTVFIFAFYFWIVDNVIGHLIDKLFQTLAKH